MQTQSNIFNRQRVRQHRRRAVKHMQNFNFLHQRAAQNLADHMQMLSYEPKRILCMGACAAEIPIKGEKTITDLSHEYLLDRNDKVKCVADEELLCFKPKSFNVVMSVLQLHWVNDVPGSLVQIQKSLAPNGVFIGNLWGGKTLYELRHSLMQAEIAITGGASMRVSPFVDIKTLGGLMQRACFQEPVMVAETTTAHYNTMFDLMHDIRGMGEGAAFIETAPPLTRDILLKAAEIYHQEFGDGRGGIEASFEMLTMTGLANA